MSVTEEDIHFMARAISLAREGKGWTSPNPMVGAILVKDGKITGEGYHEKFGSAHAEINALSDAGEGVNRATLYVTLEPCCFEGKTPPCVDALISAKIKKVVAAMEDPNPKVSGEGFRKLQQAGIEVVNNVLDVEARRLNERYIKFVTTGRPFVTVKFAQTLDGRIADRKGKSKWITSTESRKRVHAMRAEHDGVIVGSGTVCSDNPFLTVRSVNGRQPKRIVFDLKLEIPFHSNIITDSDNGQCIIYTAEYAPEDITSELESKGVNVIKVPSSYHRFDLDVVLADLAKRGVSSVFVEGGSYVFSTFLEAGYIDRMVCFINPSVLGGGLATFETDGFPISDRLKLKEVTVEVIGEDIMIEGIPDWENV